MNVFDLPNFSEEVMSKLLDTFIQNEGSTFQNKREETILQTEFLSKILTEINPVFVLETGTHKANFDYFCKLVLPNVQIVTFGNNKKSQECVEYLNKLFGTYIKFILGDSKITLLTCESNAPIDFAWIDGGHDYKTCMSDLLNCSRLNIEHICVDDYNRLVNKPVSDFIDTNNYELVSVSSDIRGIAYLRQLK